MSGADRTKRRRAADEMQTKLKSPNFFVSRTRLCVRNLPYSLDEKQLKELLVAAVRASSTAACQIALHDDVIPRFPLEYKASSA